MLEVNCPETDELIETAGNDGTIFTLTVSVKEVLHAPFPESVNLTIPVSPTPGV